MKTGCDYKELRIMFDGSLEEILLKELTRYKELRYAIIPKMKVSWNSQVKHLNTHVWPGEDKVLIVVLEEKECYELVETFLILKDNLKYTITFDIVVKALEYVNFQ